MFKSFKKLWIALGIFIALCPLGLIAAGTAVGEWGTDELPEKVGFIPAGLARFADFWSGSPLPDYGVPGMKSSFVQSAGGYILSALVGIILVVLLISMIGKIVKD